MSFKLYNAPQSTCSQRVRFVLNAKKLDFVEVKLDLLAGDQLKPEYLALNPNGVVPTLDHDGAIVIDSSVIIEYLDEVAPEPLDFTPHDPVQRAKMRSLMHFMDEMPAPAVRVPTFNLAFLPRFAPMSAWTPKSPRAADRGSSARIFRWPMSWSCRRSCAWPIWVRMARGRICRGCSAGTTAFAPIPLSRRLIIRVRCSPSVFRICARRRLKFYTASAR